MGQDQYLSMFIDEAKDHLQALNENMLELEKRPDDLDIVQGIFRSAHTLKGMSATMGFEDLASLTHEMENVLDQVRNQKCKMNGFIFDTLFKSLDALEAMVQDIVAGGTGKADVQEIVSSLQAIFRGDTPVSAAEPGKEANSDMSLDQYQYSVLQQSLDTGHKVFFIRVAVRDDCVLKAARAYMVFNVLETNGEIVKSFPTVEDIEQEKFEKIFSVYYISKLSEEALQRMIMHISEIESCEVASLDHEKLKQLASVKAEQAAGQSASGNDGHRGVADSHPNQARQNVHVNRTIRVDIERLDTLMNLFSELLIDRVRMESLAAEIRRNDLTETVEHMARISTDLQNIVLKLRMVPVDTVFNRFPRMIRDLAKSLDKKVELVITGADTELDRTVIDEIGDPLVHLLRNALDHGIEAPADRMKAGKPETGTIYLRAFHSGNHVFIEIEEDGRGINRDKVLKTALKKGIVTQEDAKKMSDDDVYQLLFASGFSTAEKISDISGRGVGLDVVKNKITSLGGSVTVESQAGKGTKFSVQLPLTLSIISAMLVKAGAETFAIPLTSIVETNIVQTEQIKIVQGRRMVDFRDSIIPLVQLAELFECPGAANEEKSEWEAIVIRKGEKYVTLLVDTLVGQQEIVLKTLGNYLKKVFAVSGATILGDGRVALIIDPNAIIK
ncbi:MAG TPA: chemotaxis protein CheA [Bacilli bacterium]